MIEPERSKDNSPLLNYDPARYSEYQDYIPVLLFVKGQARTLFIPAEMVNNRTLFERSKAISRACNLYNRAYRMIDPVKLEVPQAVETISELVWLAAAGVIIVNLWTISGLKLAASNYSGVILKGDSDICPESHEEADSIFADTTTDRLMANIKPDLFNEIKSNLDAIWFVWGHIFFSLLYAMQRDHGPIDAIDPDRREDLFEHYKKSEEFGAALGRGAHLYGREIAQRWLMGKKPAELSIESLMDFMDIELSNNESGDSYIATFQLTVGQIERFINSVKKENHVAPVALSYSEDGKIKLELEMTASDLTPLIAKAAKSTHGGWRYARVPAMSDDTKKALGKRYVELKNSLKNVKLDVKAAYEIKGKGWRKHILNKYPVLKNHRDLLEAVNVYAALDDEQGSDEKAAWEIAMQIAAREVIPNYESISIEKRPGADALRKAAIIPEGQE